MYVRGSNQNQAIDTTYVFTDLRRASLYRLLFGSCTYHQADLAGEPNLHFEHSTASLLPRQLKDNDFLPSTQVLKHVENSSNCLQECYRVLKPGVYLC